MGAAGMNESAREPAGPPEVPDVPTEPSMIVPPPAVPPVLPPVLPPPSGSSVPPVLPTLSESGADLPTQAVPASSLMGDAATELLRQPGPPGVGDAPITGDVDGGALDDIFGADQFREYVSEPLLRPSRAEPAPSASAPTASVPPPLPTAMGPGVAGLARDSTGNVNIPGYYDIGERGDPLRDRPVGNSPLGAAGAGGAAWSAGPGDAAGAGDASRASGSNATATETTENTSALTRTQKTLLWVSGGLLAVIALFALFLLGTRIPEWTAEPAPIVTEEPEPEPEPEPDPLEGVPDGVPLPAGDWAWDLLRGGECLDPFESPWAEEFTVVDCAEPHAAQLIQRAEFPEATDEFPGPEALAAPLSLICSSPEVLNFEAASAFDDILVQTAYPVTAEEWEAGYREFFCFVTRAEGEPLEGDLSLADTAE